MEFERRLAILTGIGVVAFVLALVWRGEPIVDPNLVVLMRFVIALAMGVVGATIPGFLNLEWKGSGLLVRASGALALFVLALVFTPTVLGNGQVVQINKGDHNVNAITGR
jgi:hypothetical protein